MGSSFCKANCSWPNHCKGYTTSSFSYAFIRRCYSLWIISQEYLKSQSRLQHPEVSGIHLWTLTLSWTAHYLCRKDKIWNKGTLFSPVSTWGREWQQLCGLSYNMDADAEPETEMRAPGSHFRYLEASPETVWGAVSLLSFAQSGTAVWHE